MHIKEQTWFNQEVIRKKKCHVCVLTLEHLGSLCLGWNPRPSNFKQFFSDYYSSNADKPCDSDYILSALC